MVACLLGTVSVSTAQENASCVGADQCVCWSGMIPEERPPVAYWLCSGNIPNARNPIFRNENWNVMYTTSFQTDPGSARPKMCRQSASESKTQNTLL